MFSNECRYNTSNRRCELSIEVDVLNEALEESLEVYHEMRDELILREARIKLLEEILNLHNIEIPDTWDVTWT